uniref:Uncharacterized protein n=1 Tax=Romanomermis culicivorax TaxID=13658 RepID=A0A915KM21_ROMCU
MKQTSGIGIQGAAALVLAPPPAGGIIDGPAPIDTLIKGGGRGLAKFTRMIGLEGVAPTAPPPLEDAPPSPNSAMRAEYWKRQNLYAQRNFS